MMATIMSDTQPGGHLHLLGLPTEMQTMIFDFAYQQSREAEFVGLSAWRKEQSILRQRAEPKELVTTSRHPRTTVSDFFISKQYFVTAAKSYARSRTFDKLAFVMSTRLEPALVFEAFACVVIAPYFLLEYTKLANVRGLKAAVELDVFEGGSGEIELPVLRKLLTAQELEASPVANSLDHIKGVVRRFQLVAEDLSRYELSTEEERIWPENIITLKSVVKPRITAPRVEDGDAQSCILGALSTGGSRSRSRRCGERKKKKTNKKKKHPL